MNNRILTSVASAVLLVGASIAMVILRRAGVIDDNPTRGVMVIIGLLLALYSNLIPKTFTAKSARALAVKRLAGWVFVLSGLGYAAVWMFAPFESAPDWSMAVVGPATLFVLASCLWARSRPSPTA
ncbi:MAG: hypothetical protein JSR45_00955 [Proteobacteria bacterium]|nr:hypothetical protein [Pseudomonadota bacterium]